MPYMNGFELYKEIKKKDKTVKVFFLTVLNEMMHLRRKYFLRKVRDTLYQV
jgi:hypothetical protein